MTEALSFSLAGRTVMVTGASSGLGAHFAALCSSAGANVVLGARRTDRIEQIVANLKAAGGKAVAVPLNVADEASTIAAFDTAIAHFGSVDSIIANAGTSASGRSVDTAVDGLRAMFDTNLLGVYLTAREGARRLIAADSRTRGHGRIVLIGSITADMTGQGDAGYAATKAAVAHLGRNFAREWVRHGINVNVVQPGFVRTELSAEWFDSPGGKDFIAGLHRRRLLDLESLDAMILFLCSDASRQMTGATLTIDDGQRL